MQQIFDLHDRPVFMSLDIENCVRVDIISVRVSRPNIRAMDLHSASLATRYLSSAAAAGRPAKIKRISADVPNAFETCTEPVG